MRWTERQQSILSAMGLKPWGPARKASAPAPAPVEAAVMAQEPAPPTAAPRPSPAPVAPAAPVAARPITVTRDKPAPMAGAAALAGAAVQALRPEADKARAAEIAQMDWAGLQEAVRQCQACGLCQSRKQTVFGVGHEHAHWMIVGEAPGEQEDQQGEPFVGAAGQLLDRMLAALALSRSEGDAAQRTFIANTLKCRPPRNRNPSAEEMAQCAPFLQRQIELVKPKLILAMGRFAIQQLLGTEEPIGKLRGRLHSYQGTPVVVTYHPAYLLRQPLDKAKAWADLCLAADTVEKLPG
ncbi:uracil-DNA glycosylase [Ideonella paludis]|uniref:Type-4 uracil-DNA glycosylase n=1 Tax=Ideonella paludis TaxID=1233411 RepID=A0ABS5DZK7_9BURK|nr:uracil-DNA glycosylase [Ideonella paludis]MBQ0936572.1 uracil-DNA glycosylase [Ideonella paludis]